MKMLQRWRSVVVALALIAPSVGVAESAVANSQEPSPSGCRIVHVTNPHYAESVTGAVKVNVKSQCAQPVPEQTLTVTLLVDGQPRVRTETKANNKAYLKNQDTFVRCTDFVSKHQFQGAALGVSWEDGEPYPQARQGSVIELPCGV